MKVSIAKLHLLSALAIAFLLTACNMESGPVRGIQEDASQIVKVNGEVHSANSRNFGPPAVPKIWQYTIASMAADGTRVAKGEVVVQFDTQELKTKILTKSNALNEKEKQLLKQEILTRESLAELRLAVDQALVLQDGRVERAVTRQCVGHVLAGGERIRDHRRRREDEADRQEPEGRAGH